MKTLKKFEFPVASSKFGESTYPWDEILDGSIRQLTQGEDFPITTKPSNFRFSIVESAKKRHKTVQVHIGKEEPIVVTVKASPMTDEQAAEADAAIEAKKAADKASRDKKKAEKATTSAPSVEPTAETQPVS